MHISPQTNTYQIQYSQNPLYHSTSQQSMQDHFTPYADIHIDRIQPETGDTKRGEVGLNLGATKKMGGGTSMILVTHPKFFNFSPKIDMF